MTLAVTAAAAIALSAGVPSALATDRILSPDEPRYVKDKRTTPETYERFAAKRKTMKATKAAPSVNAESVRKTPKPEKSKAPKPHETPPEAAKKASLATSTPVAKERVSSLHPEPPHAERAKKTTKGKKQTYDTANADVVQKTGSLSANVLLGSLATILFFNSTRDETFTVPDVATPESGPAGGHPEGATAPTSVAAAGQNAASAQGWIDAWSKARPSEDKMVEAETYAAESALANAKAAQAWIDAWMSTSSSEEEIAQSATYGEEAAAARAAEAQRWINAWVAQTPSFGIPAGSVAEAQRWIEEWEKNGEPANAAEKEEAKGFLKKFLEKLFGGFGKK